MPPSSPRLTLRMRNKIRLQNDLLEAILDLFCESGFSACTVDKVAQCAGCAKATVYAHFPGGRDEMLCTLYEQISDELSSQAEKMWETAKTSQDRIIAISDALLTLSTQPRIGKFYAQLNPLLIPVLEPVAGKGSQLYTEMLSKELSQISKSHADVLATLLVGSLREAAIKVAENPGRKKEMLKGITTMVESLFTQLVLRG